MTTADGSVAPAVLLVDHGPVERRFNIVVLSDGFQAAEIPVFRAAVDKLVVALKLIRPTRQLWPLVNVLRVDVTSTDSGIDHPTLGVFRDTFFDSNAPGRPRVVRCDEALVHATCRQAVSQYHFAVLLVNDPGNFASAARGVAMAAIGVPGSLPQVVVHELGHSAFGLADEYDEDGDPSGYSGPEPPEANVTAVTDPTLVKWRSFGTSPLPVVPNTDCSKTSANDNALPVDTIGVIAGARNVHCGISRPRGTCLMRSTGDQICPVCLDVMQTALRGFRPLTIERSRFAMSAEPLMATTVDLPGGPHVLTYAVVSGDATLQRVSPDATALTSTLTLSLTLGWTSIVPIPLTGGAHLLLHDAVTGRTEISKVAADGSAITTVIPTTWSRGWTTMTSFVLGGRTMLFSYKEGSGRAAIDQVAADGTGTLPMFDGPLELGFTAFAAIERFDPSLPTLPPGGALLAGYQRLTGTVVLFLVGDRGTSITELARLSSLPLASSFVPVTARRELVLAAFSAPSGEARWLYAGDVGLTLTVPTSMPKEGFSLAELGTSAWSPGWTAIAPFELAGRTHWFAHRASDGTAVIDRID